MLPESEPARVGLEYDGVIPLLYRSQGIVINPDDMAAEVWAQRCAEEQS